MAEFYTAEEAYADKADAALRFSTEALNLCQRAEVLAVNIATLLL